jgi:SAM-dependent methyltransferase
MDCMMAQDYWKNTTLNLKPPVRPPWHPSREDGAFMREWTRPILEKASVQRILVLGVTPEVVQLGWPLDAHIVGIDSSPAMVASLWQGNGSTPSHVTCARWQQMPVSDGAFDVVVGDGSLNALPSLDEYGEVLDEVSRVLKPGGVLVLRCFVRPPNVETPERVLLNAMAGEFPTTAAFRLRFAFAVADADGSIGLKALHDAFNALVPDRDALARITGWPRQDIDRVDNDKDSRVRLTFPTQSQLVSVSEPIFRIEGSARGTYTQADHCPTFLFRPIRKAV